MHTSRPFVVHYSRLPGQLRALYHFRPLRTPRKGADSFRKVNVSQPQPSLKLSLLEELFPEEVPKDNNQNFELCDDGQKVPRLPLPEVEDFQEDFEHESDRERSQPRRVTKAAATNAFRQQQLAVLALEEGSKSLIESDFRRIAPKGQHIDDWTGPGDILKSELKRHIFARYLCANLNHSHSRSRPQHAGTDRSLLHTIPQPRVRSNLSGSCPPSAPNGQNLYANIYRVSAAVATRGGHRG